MPNQTGPRTEEGKQASSQNNRRHGLSTANIIVAPEERPFFDQLEADLRDEVQPDGPLEELAFRRLLTATWQMEKCQQQEATLRALQSDERNEANLEKVHRYYRRWEGSYNSAFRQLRVLQTDRVIIAYNNSNAPDTLPPLADVPKIEQFARRIAKPFTFDDQVRKALNTQLAIITLENQISGHGADPVSSKLYAEAARQAHASPANSTTCETKSPHHAEVGRNSPCPCGSGQKYKRCPPILNRAA